MANERTISPTAVQADLSVTLMKGLALLVPAFGVFLVLWRKPIHNVPFPTFPRENIIGLLTGLIVIALFIERAVEVLLAPLRQPTCNIMKETARNERVILPKERVTELLDTERQLVAFKGQTRRFASLMGLALGMAISASGVRGLASLLDAKNCCTLFNVLDVLLTGAILAGGADGLHRIATVFTGYMDLTARSLDAKRTVSQPNP